MPTYYLSGLGVYVGVSSNVPVGHRILVPLLGFAEEVPKNKTEGRNN
jgi:hypothetical protein